MVHVSAEARLLFEKDSRSLWREGMGLLSRLASSTSPGGAEPPPEVRSLVRRFLHAVHSLKGLLAMLPETEAHAMKLQELEAVLSFRSPAELRADFSRWESDARTALVEVGVALGLDLPAMGEVLSLPAAAWTAEALDEADDSGDSGWIVHLNDEGTVHSLWVAATRVEHWEDVPARDGIRDLELGWTIQPEGWVRVLGTRPSGEGTVRAVVLALGAQRGRTGESGSGVGRTVMIYTESIEWLVSRERARLQGLERLEDWVRRRISSFGANGSITPKEDSVETHFDVGTRTDSGSSAA